MAVTVISNVRTMQCEPPFEVLEGVDVVISGDCIVALGRDAGRDVKADRVIDGTGKTLIPGNICSHHHYYSGLSRGMLVKAGPQTDFIQVLKEWWWRRLSARWTRSPQEPPAPSTIMLLLHISRGR